MSQTLGYGYFTVRVTTSSFTGRIGGASRRVQHPRFSLSTIANAWWRWAGGNSCEPAHRKMCLTRLRFLLQDCREAIFRKGNAQTGHDRVPEDAKTVITVLEAFETPHQPTGSLPFE